MKLMVSVALFCAAIAASALFGLQYLGSDPSTETLDQDIAAVEDQITSAKADQSAYGPGALHTIIEARIEILKATHAMLGQKRLSMLRRIDLNYTVEGSRHVPDETIISALEADRTAAEQERDRFTAEAARYSGGLIQTIALLNAATSELAIVQVDLALLSERYGFLFDMSGQRGRSADPIAQNTVDDAEAL